ncbi:hypothetical protein [Marinomonas sp. GJ51-6]|uniref:hypothetical protein n=1 Tax=Marinomonas sp. GJ51-6 TaxID=2992802 RepID=UPI0029347A41|nr:hypothetical protein [Marinomonas sp. GJ51-6]WOD09368.1 hypothetical protein ONZ50_19105 [Marinomonas sp. GJ51-6]
MFHAFYRSSEAREANSGGFGVGTHYFATYHSSHKGTISARNREEGGLEVCFQLPVA